MKQAYKAALTDRLNNVGLVSPTLAEAQAEQMDTVRDIETITGEILEAKRVGGEAIITIGQRLIEAKALLSHGEWLPWLNEKVEFSERTAQVFMRLAREWSNPQALADLGATKALALLALPESEREEFLSETHQVNGEEKTVVDMTSRELEKAIKEKNELLRERDEARKAAEQAKADAKAAAEDRASMEESLKTVNELLDRAMTDKELADGAVTALEEQLAELKAAPVDVAVMQVDQEALDKARAEGEAAKAAEAAKLQASLLAKLDKAREDKKRSDERRKNAEAQVDCLKLQLEESAKAKEQADAMADPDVVECQVYLNELQGVANKMKGVLLKVQRREDKSIYEGLTKATLAASDFVRRIVE